VLPGELIQIRLSDNIKPTDLSPVCYYNVEQIAIQARNTPYTGTFSQATERFTELLENSVAQQLVSDVPLGAFLSGGIDSSLVVASMAKLSKSPVLTFSIGFEEDSFNEAQHAREVAAHLGTNHTEFIVTDAEALAVIPKLARHFDDPFGDSSEIPTLLLTELTRRHVTVALSGDGGDELFGGYNRYFIGANLWSKVGRIPQPVRRGGSRVLRGMSSQRLDQVGRAVSMKGRYFFDGRLSARATKLAALLDLNRLDEVYKAVVSHWTDDIVIGTRWLDSAIDQMDSLSPAEQMMILDTQRYLPSDILVKVDRASMANSLETRVPFLDPDLFEFAWSLPLEYKIKGREGKVISKAALEKMVPRQLWDRPKKGFAIPLEKWLKHGLRDWAEELLLDQSIAPGLLDNNAVMNCWAEHQNGENNNQDRLWDVLMLKMWIKEWATVV
jgi:asparagine synthase (glutamine-hydrolysing)